MRVADIEAVADLQPGALDERGVSDRAEEAANVFGMVVMKLS